MDFTLSEEQRLLRDSVRRYVDTRYSHDRRKQIAASQSGCSAEVWANFAEFGWLAMPLPEAYGGLQGGPVEVSLLMEEFGRGLVLEPYVSTVVLGAGLIASAGTEAQRARWLPAVAEGRIRLAFAHAEPGTRHYMHRVHTAAQKTPGGWRLRGNKHLVLDGPGADALVVSARISGHPDDADGIALFIVPRPFPQLKEQVFMTVDGRRACHIQIDDLQVGDEAWLGDDTVMDHIESCLDLARVAMTADALGCMRALLDATIEYTKTRVQFERPLSANQVLRHRMVDMAVHCEEAQSMLLLAMLKAGGNARERALAVSAAMNKVVRGARFVAEQAVQLHGAMGVTDDVIVGSWLKRLIAYEATYGTPGYHLRRHATLSGLMAAA